MLVDRSLAVRLASVFLLGKDRLPQKPPCTIFVEENQCHMDYPIHNDTLLEGIKKEISKVAASAYADDGSALYEGINIFSSDEGTVSGFMTDAVHEIVRRLYDICLIGEGKDGDSYDQDGNLISGGEDFSLMFDVPDFATTLENTVEEALTRYIVLYSCACWCRMKYPSLGEDYGNKAASELERIVGMLKGRKKPSRL